MTSSPASRVADTRVPPVSGWEREKEEGALCAGELGCAESLRGLELAGLAQLGAGGSAFSNFFLTKDFSSFSNSKTTTTFDLKLQMSSNQFLKFCTN